MDGFYCVVGPTRKVHSPRPQPRTPGSELAPFARILHLRLDNTCFIDVFVLFARCQKGGLPLNRIPFLDMIEANGGVACVVHSVEELDQDLRSLLLLGIEHLPILDTIDAPSLLKGSAFDFSQ